MKRLTGRAADGTAYLYNMGGTNEAIDRLAAYEDTGLELEEIRMIQQIKEFDDAHQFSPVDEELEEKCVTNADSIRQMTDEELSNLLSTVQSSIALNVINALQPCFGKAYYDNAIKQVKDRTTQNQREWLDWLRQEANDD